MGRVFRLVFAFVVLAAPARADITPEQVWSQLQHHAETAGLTLTTGGTERRADRLVLTDIVTTRQSSEGGGTTTASLPELTLRDMGDGRVEVTGAQVLQLRSTFTPPGGARTEVTGTLTQTDARAVVSGTPDDLTIALTVPRAEGKTETTRATTPPGKDSALTTVETLAGDLRLKRSLPGLAEGTLTAARIAATGSNNTAGRADITLTGLAVKATSDLPEFVEGADFPGLKADGSVALASVEARIAGQMGDAGTGGDFTYTLTDFATAGSLDIGPVPGQGPSPAIATEGTLSIGRMAMNLNTPDPGEAVRMTSDADALRLALSASIPQGAIGDDLALGPALAAGLSVSGSLDIASSASDAAIASPEFQLDYATRTGPFRGELALSKTGLLFDLAQADTSVTVETPMLPGPASGSMKELALRVAVPVTPGEPAAPFVLTQRIVGLTLADTLWDMADPARAVTRGPLTFVMDISGTTRVLRDVFDDGAPADDMPFAPESLDVTDLRLSFGPADIRGTGSFTFDPATDLPKPVGRFNATIKGLYALMNQIGETGLVPPEAFLGLRGGLAVVTKAKGADDLVSDIEVKADGTVMANGRKLALPGPSGPEPELPPEIVPIPPPLAPSPAAP